METHNIPFKYIFVPFLLIAFLAFALLFHASGTSAATTLTAGNPFKQGGTSNSQIIPGFPSWSFNIPLLPPQSFAAASSTSPGGSLATSSAKMYFEVAATNGTGTSTVSTELSTTTTTGSSRIHLSWTPSPGATGYFVYFSTTTPGAENAYFAATSTSAFDFTSTSSPIFGTPPTFPSSFALQLSNATNPLQINGLNASAFATTTSPIGGSALSAGQCATATSTLTIGVVGSSTSFMTTPQKFPGSSVVWQSYALGPTQVVTEVCALLGVTPIATSYNVRAF